MGDQHTVPSADRRTPRTTQADVPPADASPGPPPPPVGTFLDPFTQSRRFVYPESSSPEGRANAIERPGASHPLMRHPVRQAIVTWVDEHPGGHLGELVRTLHLGWGNAHHHLDRMIAEGLLLQEHESNRVHLFLPGQVPRDERRLFSVLEHDCLRSLVSVVNDNPGINQRKLAEELGITATAARKHVRRLVSEGILDQARRGKQVHYELAAPLPEGILQTGTSAPEDPLDTLAGLYGAVER